MGAKRSRDADGESAYERTISGIGVWTGLMPVAKEVYVEYGETRGLDHEAVVQRVDRQLQRYQWFCERIERPRPAERCARTLEQAPAEPSAWERALAELSMLGSLKAKVVLERWELPEDDLDLELFRRVCIARCSG